MKTFKHDIGIQVGSWITLPAWRSVSGFCLVAEMSDKSCNCIKIDKMPLCSRKCIVFERYPKLSYCFNDNWITRDCCMD